MVRKIILTAIALVSILTLNTQAATTPENVIKETIVKHSIEMDVDPALALSIAKKDCFPSLKIPPKMEPGFLMAAQVSA